MYIYDSISLNTSWGEKIFRTVLEKASSHFSPKIVQFAKQLQEIRKSDNCRQKLCVRLTKNEKLRNKLSLRLV